MQTRVGIEGLADLRRAVRVMDRTLDRDLTDRLKEAAEPVAEEVRRRIPVRSGRARRSVKPFARRNLAGVAVSARDRRTGYAYPKRLNYDPASRSAGFMEASLEAKAREVEDRVARLLGDLARDWGNQRGIG